MAFITPGMRFSWQQPLWSGVHTKLPRSPTKRILLIMSHLQLQKSTTKLQKWWQRMKTTGSPVMMILYLCLPRDPLNKISVFDSIVCVNSIYIFRLYECTQCFFLFGWLATVLGTSKEIVWTVWSFYCSSLTTYQTNNTNIHWKQHVSSYQSCAYMTAISPCTNHKIIIYFQNKTLVPGSHVLTWLLSCRVPNTW